MIFFHEEKELAPVNSYEVLDTVAPTVREVLGDDQDFFVLGGTISKVLTQTGIIIDKADKTVAAPAGIELSTIRPNKSRRDLDILVKAILPDEIARTLKHRVQKAVGGHLLVSAFGMDAYEAAPTRPRRVGRSLMEWVSRRTIDESGTLRYEIFPLEKTVQPASYEPWTLYLRNGTELPMLNPAAHVLAYGMRSIAYIRQKDKEKVGEMRDLILPHFVEEIHDGPLREWDEFAELIHRVRDGGPGDTRVVRPGTTAEEIYDFTRKSRAMHWLEVNHPAVIDFGQGDTMQKILNPFVRAA